MPNNRKNTLPWIMTLFLFLLGALDLAGEGSGLYTNEDWYRAEAAMEQGEYEAAQAHLRHLCFWADWKNPETLDLHNLILLSDYYSRDKSKVLLYLFQAQRSGFDSTLLLSGLTLYKELGIKEDRLTALREMRETDQLIALADLLEPEQPGQLLEKAVEDLVLEPYIRFPVLSREKLISAAAKTAEQHQDYETQFRLLLDLGAACMAEDKYPEAFAYYSEAVDTGDKHNLYNAEALLLAGLTAAEQIDTEETTPDVTLKSEEFINSSVRKAWIRNDKIIEALAYYELAGLFGSRKDYRRMYDYFFQAMDTALAGGNRLLISMIANDEGSLISDYRGNRFFDEYLDASETKSETGTLDTPVRIFDLHFGQDRTYKLDLRDYPYIAAGLETIREFEYKLEELAYFEEGDELLGIPLQVFMEVFALYEEADDALFDDEYDLFEPTFDRFLSLLEENSLDFLLWEGYDIEYLPILEELYYTDRHDLSRKYALSLFHRREKLPLLMQVYIDEDYFTALQEYVVIPHLLDGEWSGLVAYLEQEQRPAQQLANSLSLGTLYRLMEHDYMLEHHLQSGLMGNNLIHAFGLSNLGKNGRAIDIYSETAALRHWFYPVSQFQSADFDPLLWQISYMQSISALAKGDYPGAMRYALTAYRMPFQGMMQFTRQEDHANLGHIFQLLGKLETARDIYLRSGGFNFDDPADLERRIQATLGERSENPASYEEYKQFISNLAEVLAALGEEEKSIFLLEILNK